MSNKARPAMIETKPQNHARTGMKIAKSVTLHVSSYKDVLPFVEIPSLTPPIMKHVTMGISALKPVIMVKKVALSATARAFKLRVKLHFVGITSSTQMKVRAVTMATNKPSRVNTDP